MVRNKTLKHLSVDELIDLREEVEQDLSFEKDQDYISVLESDLEKINTVLTDAVALENSQRDGMSQFVNSF